MEDLKIKKYCLLSYVNISQTLFVFHIFRTVALLNPLSL